jgi:hypothetical protein
MKERQELWCHECRNYVQFDIDIEQNGNHIIICPKCGHEHCRVVRDGVITETRWESRNQNWGIGSQLMNGATFYATGLTNTAVSTFTTYSAVSTNNTDGCDAFAYTLWMNMGAC